MKNVAVPEIPNLSIHSYTYALPEGKIARYPLTARDQSRLLVWREGVLSETLFSRIGEFLPGGSLVVFNNTRVIPARLLLENATGARIEVLCLEPHDPSEYHLSFRTAGMVEWKCLVGNARRWKEGPLTMEVAAGGKSLRLQAEMTGRAGNAFIVRFTWDSADSFATVIHAAGQMPIPPYLNRPAEAVDEDRYQTLYAAVDGSVAAPTAGLHFTREVMEELVNRQIITQELTLHVGAGTFQPVRTDWIAGHTMHTETITVKRELLVTLLGHGLPVVAVGTTSVRALESLYWLGANPETSLHANFPASSFSGDPSSHKHPGGLPHVRQWEPYRSLPTTEPAHALRNLLHLMDAAGTSELSFSTALMIVPGYRFRMVRGMITNFHQPQSTLLLLVAAFLGEEWKNIYDYALSHDFRFLSYGDSNLYLRGEDPAK